MRRLLLSSRISAAALALACAPALSATQEGPPLAADARPTLGLMGTIPLYWGEAKGLGEILDGNAESHWARAQLEENYRLHPLPALTEEQLAPLKLLLLAQPRALSAAENVALDGWVRGGGRLLLFADPLLTGESRFAIGDRRRPQDVILLSPILRRWGLELQFEEDQPAGLISREIAGQAVPVNLPGHFAPPVQDGCALEASGLLANCAVGAGRVLVLADAALLDLHHPAPEAAPALEMLVKRALSVGESAGNAPASPQMRGETIEVSAQEAPDAPDDDGAENRAASVHNPP